MKTSLIITIIIIILAIGSILFYQTTTKSDTVNKDAMIEKSDETMQKSDQNPLKDITAEEDKMLDNTKIQPQPLAGSTSPYYEFNPVAYSKALAENKVILLYFYADWCPICKKEQADATLPAFNELQNPNVAGFRVHYNDGKATAEERDLAKQYGITYQHTKIILKEGKQIFKDLSSWNKEKYLAELNKF